MSADSDDDQNEEPELCQEEKNVNKMDSMASERVKLYLEVGSSQ